MILYRKDGGCPLHIHKEAVDRFVVELTAKELQEFQLTYCQLHYNNTKTKELLQALIRNAGTMVGFPSHPKKLLIEVYPAPKQGCIIYFTNLSNGGKRYHKINPHIFRFATCEDLLHGVHLFQEQKPKSEAYRYGDQYILILHAAPIHGLTEFAQRLPSSKFLLAHIREHGQLLCKPNAVEQLQG